MKKLFTLIALCLGISAGAWAADSYDGIYTRTLSQWSEADKTAWNASGAVTADATNGIGANANSTATYLNKSFSIESGSKIKYEVEWAFATATGRTNNYNYIDFGSIRIAVNSSYNVYVSTDGGANWKATTLGYYYNQTKTASITLIVNTASNRVESFSFDGTDRTSIISSSDVSNTNIVKTGFIRGGSVSWTLANYIKAITVSECKQTVATADYSINYVFEGNTIKTTNGNTAVGTPINADSPIVIDGQKYYATSTPLSLTVDANASNNVLNVVLREANNYNWSVVASTGADLGNGVCTEEEKVTVAVPRYINVSGTLYETAKASDWYHHTYTISQNNQQETITYNATSITNVVLYAEAEALPGAIAGNGNGTRTSMGLTGYGTNLPVTTLAPGKYVIRIHGANGNSAARAVAFKNGENAIAEFTIAGSSNDQEYTSPEFTIIESANITLTSEGSQASGVDWFYIQKTGEAPDAIVSITPAIGYATFYDSEHAVNIPNGVTPYIFGYDLSNSSVLTLVKYEDALQRYKSLTYNGVIPAGEAVVLKGDADVELTYNATCDLPLLKDYNYLCGKDVEGTTTPPSGWQMIPCTYYALSLNSSNDPNSVGFYFMEAGGAAFTTAAHKAYLWLPFNVYEPTLAPSRFLFNEGEATAIKTVNTTANRGMMFNLAGQRVNNNAKGIVVVNGKKVLNK